MANSNKRKGDRGELEVQALLRDHLGYAARRKLGAGRTDDVGDIEGVPQHVVQVANWADVAAAARLKPVAAELQRQRAGEPYAATLVRFRGGTWRVVLTDS